MKLFGTTYLTIENGKLRPATTDEYLDMRANLRKAAGGMGRDHLSGRPHSHALVLARRILSCKAGK